MTQTQTFPLQGGGDQGGGGEVAKAEERHEAEEARQSRLRPQIVDLHGPKRSVDQLL